MVIKNSSPSIPSWHLFQTLYERRLLICCAILYILDSVAFLWYNFATIFVVRSTRIKLLLMIYGRSLRYHFLLKFGEFLGFYFFLITEPVNLKYSFPFFIHQFGHNKNYCFHKLLLFIFKQTLDWKWTN